MTECADGSVIAESPVAGTLRHKFLTCLALVEDVRPARSKDPVEAASPDAVVFTDQDQDFFATKTLRHEGSPRTPSYTL